MEEDNTIERTIFHKDYNMDKKDNIPTLPTDPAVFGIFAIMHDKPYNCRYVGEAENLQLAVKNLFENAKEVSEGFEKFMHGPWIQKLVYEPLLNSTEEERQTLVEKWTEKYNPKCDKDGGYPKKKSRR